MLNVCLINMNVQFREKIIVLRDEEDGASMQEGAPNLYRYHP